jgi:hypothetical protein
MKVMRIRHIILSISTKDFLPQKKIPFIADKSRILIWNEKSFKYKSSECKLYLDEN